MTNLAHKPPLGIKDRSPTKNSRHLALVSELPCTICHHHGEPQQSSTQVHHCISGRFATVKASDFATIPLCEGHHQGLWDWSKVAIHQSKREWEAKYGPDTNYITWTLDMIEEQKENTI